MCMQLIAHNVLRYDFALDIESALLKIDEVASNQEGIAAEEALILRGCVPKSFYDISRPHSPVVPNPDN